MAIDPLNTHTPTCTADFIALHARRRPNHVALMSDDRETTYASLHTGLTAMTAYMTGLGLPRGALVALAHPDIRPRLLVALALERLGITMVSVRADATEADDPVLGRADLVMSRSEIDMPEIGVGSRGRFIHMTDAWLDDVLSRDHGTVAPPDMSADDRVLMTRTSGSTGRPKTVVLTRAVLAARVAQRIVAHDYRAQDRCLLAMNFGAATTYYTALAFLRLGGTVISLRAVPLAAALGRYRPTKLHLLPYHLAALLRDSPDLPRMPDLALMLGGAKVAPALRRQALARLCGRVTESYGSNEAGWICTFGDAGRTRLNPWIDIDIAGEDGASLSPESVGEIRVRGPSVIAGHEGDPTASAAAARDGWWHTGDFGFFTSDGELRLLGRRDDVLNFGGIKRAAGDVEAEILALGIRHDIAVLVGQGADGDAIPQVCVAAESDPEVARIADLLRLGLFGRFAVYRVDAIPRTPEGKVARRQLRQEIAGRQPVLPAESGASDAPAREAA
jgi:acyl-coenzyme A synthetase/AMP-(fatty) acid ligase